NGWNAWKGSTKKCCCSKGCVDLPSNTNSHGTGSGAFHISQDATDELGDGLHLPSADWFAGSSGTAPFS
ncbi:hypothetical protein, partial [Yoonia sp.]|uniref:hypothetical protein n=1 Tax=Yoonia sp. TaxID=2212373 RepID=UPI0035C81AE6